MGGKRRVALQSSASKSAIVEDVCSGEQEVPDRVHQQPTRVRPPEELRQPRFPCYKCGESEFYTDNPNADVVMFVCKKCSSTKILMQKREPNVIQQYDHPVSVQSEAEPEEQSD